MAEVVVTTTVDRPPAEVWEVLAAFDAIVDWAPNVEHSSFATERTEGVGAVRRVQVGRNALLEQIVEWEPGSRLAYTITGLPPVIRSATNAWQLTPADGGTEISLTSTIDAGSGPPQRLVARIVGRVMGTASRTMLTGLRQHLEENAS